MFGKNQRVGQGFFIKSPEAQEGKLLVTSIFFTLQGEGPYAGMPAIFVRLTHCSLACSFCDTDFSRGDWMHTYQIEQAIDRELKRAFIDDVPDGFRRYVYEEDPGQWVIRRDNLVLVVTGGEPTLQANLKQLLEEVGSQFKHTQIESHGIHAPDVPDSTTVVVSPKCLERDGKPLRYLRPNQDTLARADCLKFIVENDPDSPYYTVPDWAHAWAKETGKPVYVSPMNRYLREPQQAKEARVKNSSDLTERSTVEEVISFWDKGLLDMEANQRNHEYSSDYALRNGFRWQMQMHLFAGKA